MANKIKKRRINTPFGSFILTKTGIYVPVRLERLFAK
jgi:hypothetical protein